MTPQGVTRREFIRVSLLAGGAMLIEACTGSSGASTTVVSTGASTSLDAATGPAETPAPDVVFEPNLWVRIDGGGAITVTGHRTEMGQGVLTALAMLVAEELDADWETVRVVQADGHARYGKQNTGGSTTITESYTSARRAGAAARRRLVLAAAARWGVDPSECSTAASRVRHEATDRSLGFGELVAEAATIEGGSSSAATTKDPAQFRIVGTPRPLTHSWSVVDGSAVFGSDVQVHGMRHVVVAYPPSLGGRVVSYDDAGALAVPGVERVVQVPRGIAVVADSTWAALQGRTALAVQWDAGPRPEVDSDEIRRGFLEDAGTEYAYGHPFYAHASLEPMSCVIDVTGSQCEVWAPVQLPQDARRVVSRTLRIALDDVALHVPLSGGRFGRGLHIDYVEDLAHVAAAVGGALKLFWTREDDIHQDLFHPLTLVTATSTEADPLRTIRLDRRRASGLGIPTGFWRSVEGFSDAFAHECYFDELAVGLGLDPVEARLGVLPARAAEVVQVAAREAAWGKPLPDGWGRGIAYHSTWGETEVAEVAEVSVVDGEIRVHRVVCAVDCGTVVNPDTVSAQMEGGIVFGLTAALKSGIDVAAGSVVQRNLHDYPLLRFDEMPTVEVHIVASDAHPSGVGEMAVPPLAPAVANAVFAATGRRLRSLPLRLNG